MVDSEFDPSANESTPVTDAQPADNARQDIHYVREMGLDHRDFFRLLPRAMDGYPYEVDGTQVRATVGAGSVDIEIGAEQRRQIALLALPYCEVSFTFRGVTLDEQQAFKAHFDLHYQRGGG